MLTLGREKLMSGATEFACSCVIKINSTVGRSEAVCSRVACMLAMHLASGSCSRLGVCRVQHTVLYSIDMSAK